MLKFFSFPFVMFYNNRNFNRPSRKNNFMTFSYPLSFKIIMLFLLASQMSTGQSVVQQGGKSKDRTKAAFITNASLPDFLKDSDLQLSFEESREISLIFSKSFNNEVFEMNMLKKYMNRNSLKPIVKQKCLRIASLINNSRLSNFDYIDFLRFLKSNNIKVQYFEVLFNKTDFRKLIEFTFILVNENSVKNGLQKFSEFENIFENK